SGADSAAAPDYARALNGNVRGLRIGVPESYFFNNVHPEVAAALRRALALLKEMGAGLVDVTVRNAEMCSPASTVILGSESTAFHEKRLKESADLFDPLVRERLEAGAFYSATDYIKALRVRTLLKDEMLRLFQTCDVLMLPAGNAAPKLAEEIVETDVPPNPPPPARPDSFNLANVTGIPAIVLPCGFTAGPPV